VFCPEESCQLIVRYVIVDLPDGQEPKLTETDKCGGWSWVNWEDVKKLAMYNQQVTHGRHYKELSTVLKSSLQHDDPAIRHKFSTSQNSNQLLHPLNVQSLYSPKPPTFSEGCPFELDKDHLFAPMMALAVTPFDPLTAQPTDYL
jgi:hypothetical protein